MPTTDNLYEMDQFLKIQISQNSHKKRQSEDVYVKEIEPAINTLPKLKAPGPDGLAGEFYKMLMEENMPLSHNLSQRIETEGTTPNLFFQVSIILILNPKTLQETTDEYRS